MKALAWLAGLGLVLAACSSEAEPPEPDASRAIPPPRAERIIIVGEMPSEALDRGLERLTGGEIVQLDVTMGPDAVPGDDLENCPVGPLTSVELVDLPTVTNHLLVTVRPGTANLHAANLVTCEYAIGDAGPMTVRRVRGCYLALEYSVATAQGFILNPLPASACGVGVR